MRLRLLRRSESFRLERLSLLNILPWRRSLTLWRSRRPWLTRRARSDHHLRRSTRLRTLNARLRGRRSTRFWPRYLDALDLRPRVFPPRLFSLRLAYACALRLLRRPLLFALRLSLVELLLALLLC